MDAVEDSGIARSKLFCCFLRRLLALLRPFSCDIAVYLCHRYREGSMGEE